MPATQKSSVESGIKILGVIAGGGALPGYLLYACERKNINSFVVGFEGQTDPGLVQGRNHMWARLGAIGQIINTLKAHHVQDIVLIGSIQKPSLFELKPDLWTAKFLARTGMRSLGDNDVLSSLRKALEKEGFAVHGAHEFAQDLIAEEGVVGMVKPSKADWADIRYGFKMARAVGALDIGQAVIVQQGMVLAVEAIEGTDALIRRSKYLLRQGRGAILVKSSKPQQDTDIDLPTIGPDTAREAAEAGLAGIAIEAGNSLLVDPQRVAEIADQHRMFVVGVDPAKIESE